MTNGTRPLPAVSRLLILGYYDGATDGVLQCGDGGPVFRFNHAGEEQDPGDLDRRTFKLRPLPADALARLTAVIGCFHPPTWPVWLPVWSFPSDEAQRSVEGAVGAVLSSAGSPLWTITTADHVRFADIVATPAARPTPA